MNVLWRSLARMSAKLIFLLSVAGCFGTLAYASEGIITTATLGSVEEQVRSFYESVNKANQEREYGITGQQSRKARDSSTWPTGHPESAASAMFAYFGDQFYVYMWRADDNVWLEVVPLVSKLFICGPSFDIFQDGAFRRYSVDANYVITADPNGNSIVDLETSTGERQCGDIQTNSIFKLKVWSFAAKLADIHTPFTLYYSVRITGVEHPIFSLDLAGNTTVNPPVTTNQPPVASFTVTPAEGEAPLKVIADANGSNDPDGTIVEYRWFIGAQRLSDLPVDKTTVDLTFNTPTTYNIQLTVVDDKGATAIIKHPVTVTGNVVDNVAPIADFTFTPEQGTAPLTVALDAGISSDPDGSIAGYQWSVNGQTLSGKTVSVTLDKAGNYPITLTVTDDKGLSATKTNSITVIQPTQSNSEFCASGNVNVDLTGIQNCVNGNCNSPSVKITCNNQNCQWCDASNNCGNILYAGVTPIPGGSISCTNGQCSYSIQAGGVSLSDNFNCKAGGSTSQPTTVNTTPTNKVETVNPVVSKSIYQDGDQVKITIPKTPPTGQSQYFGIELPNNMGLFLAKNLNEFYSFDGSTLLEWQGGDTAIDIPLTPDLPRGKYTAYLLRSLKGIDPLKASENQSALGVNSFVITEGLTAGLIVTQITDPQTSLGAVLTDDQNMEVLAVFGQKDSQGQLTSVTELLLSSLKENDKWVRTYFGEDHLPSAMEFSDGTKVKYTNFTDNSVDMTAFDASGNVFGSTITQPIDAEKLKQLKTLNPKNTRDAIKPGCIPRWMDHLMWFSFQGLAVVSCGASTVAAFATCGMLTPAAVWACGSIVLSSIDRTIKNLNQGESPIVEVTKGNSLLKTTIGCTNAMKSPQGCIRGVAGIIYSTAKEKNVKNSCEDTSLSSDNAIVTGEGSYRTEITLTPPSPAKLSIGSEIEIAFKTAIPQNLVDMAVNNDGMPIHFEINLNVSYSKEPPSNRTAFCMLANNGCKMNIKIVDKLSQTATDDISSFIEVRGGSDVQIIGIVIDMVAPYLDQDGSYLSLDKVWQAKIPVSYSF